MTAEQGARAPGRVHPRVERLAAYSWRLIVIAVVAMAAVWLMWRLRLIVLPLIVALLLSVVLSAPAQWLRRKGAPPALSAWTVMVGFLAVLGFAGWVVVPALIDEFTNLGGTIEQGVEDFQEWLVEDSPFDLNRQDVENFQEEAREAGMRALRSNVGTIVTGVVLVLEIVTGLVLALVITFFFVKDGERIQEWALGHFAPRRRDMIRRLAGRAWETLAGYLRGSAMLGVVEALTIGTALFLVGGDLVIPVMVLTFVAAFIPFVGAIVAGIIAILVALVTAGTTPAIIVAVVALLVQQFDNDLLAPVVFGHALQLHPVVILVAITAGASIAGVVGAFLGVPVTAVVINVVAEYRAALAEEAE